MADRINAMEKQVASTTLRNPPWNNTLTAQDRTARLQRQHAETAARERQTADNCDPNTLRQP
jgi:hypothetical protein